MRVHPSCATCYCVKPPTWRKFEYTWRDSDKFWNIKQEGSKVWTHFGRAYTDGTKILKEFSYTVDATNYVNRMINEKLNKGYEETT
jgi:predicted DNA-binding WGR domain protein